MTHAHYWRAMNVTTLCRVMLVQLDLARVWVFLHFIFCHPLEFLAVVNLTINTARRFCLDVSRLWVVPLSPSPEGTKSVISGMKSVISHSHFFRHGFLLCYMNARETNERGTTHSLWYVTNFPELTEKFDIKTFNLNGK